MTALADTNQPESHTFMKGVAQSYHLHTLAPSIVPSIITDLFIITDTINGNWQIIVAYMIGSVD